jgi:hypothetical protein
LHFFCNRGPWKFHCPRFPESCGRDWLVMNLDDIKYNVILYINVCIYI